MTLTMTVSGTDRSLKFDWPAASASWAKTVTPAALSLMRAHAPFRTGAMRQGIHSRLEPGPGRMWVVLYSTSSYTPFALGGTRAHTIVPRRVGGTLRWVANSGHGPVRFAKLVHHPGTKPNDFPKRAIDPVTPMIVQRFVEAVKEATFRA